LSANPLFVTYKKPVLEIAPSFSTVLAFVILAVNMIKDRTA